MSADVIAKLRELLPELHVNGLMISGATNRRYATGYTAEDHAPDEISGVLLLDSTASTLFVSANNTEWAASEAPEISVEGWKRPWEKHIAQRIKELGWKRVGFEDRALNVNSFELLKAAESGIVWIPIGAAADALRASKTPSEIGDLATAIRLTDEIFVQVAESLSTSDTERDIVWRIERLIRETTSGTVAFSSGIGGGPHSARPHHAATDRTFRESEPIVIDMGVAFNGYCGDLTRTIWLGEAPEKLRSVYNAVYRAQRIAIGAISAGVRAKDVDQLARDEIERSGFGEYIVHSLGHGVGLRIHEAPSLSIQSEEILQPGHVVTVEPGIYIPGWGGVRIEDVVVVTEDGCNVLTAAPKHSGWDI